ncbi:hypothetical protein FD754_015643, partial [Muntiacus muntjak]
HRCSAAWDNFHYVAMDFGGHGLSSHYSRGFPYYHQNFVSEVRRVAAAQKWNRFSLLGHSFGATVGGMFSCIFPEMVDKLILLGSMRVSIRADETAIRLDPNSPPSQSTRQFLKNNSDVGEACGKHLLQRGTTQVATGLRQELDWGSHSVSCLQNYFLMKFFQLHAPSKYFESQMPKNPYQQLAVGLPWWASVTYLAEQYAKINLEAFIQMKMFSFLECPQLTLRTPCTNAKT